MEIRIYDYIVKDESKAPTRFNLYKETISLKGKFRENAVAYAIPLSRVMDIIASKRSTSNEFKDLKAFIEHKLVEIEELIKFFDQKKYSVKELKKEVKSGNS